MVRRILHNFATRLATALLSFAIVWLTARYLGAAGRGAVSLFVTDCAVLLLFIGFLGGSSLIYLAPKHSIWSLLVPAYVWATVVCTAGTAAVGLLRQVSWPYLGHLWGLSLVQAFFTINTLLLLGRKKDGVYNLFTVLQVAILAGLLLLAFTGSYSWRAVTTYYYATYLAYGLPLILSWLVLLRLPDRWEAGHLLRATTRELASNSRGAHFSNILSFINYRLSYYFVAHYTGARAVGVLSVGVALAEAIWLIPRSAALIQYVDLVHATDKQAQVASTLRVARLSVLATVLAVLVLCALPPAVLVAVFGPEFGASRPVILLLAPGVAIMAINMICSSYFGGIGQYRVNNLATTLGLGVTIPACWLLIPAFGIRGAAAANTLSYLASTAYLVWSFKQTTGAGLRAFLPSFQDVKMALSKQLSS
ncbi:lipopolysaccharide biosynthesis protein [Hymenobacter cavernae]|nr:polysaccharide biosynthesis C-terminal domain-containing protein [Hymenobacter cavernae]